MHQASSVPNFHCGSLCFCCVCFYFYSDSGSDSNFDSDWDYPENWLQLVVAACYYSVSYTHLDVYKRQDLWHETSAYVCAFPPLRDKVVLNIVDGLIGCFEGGPAANPQFICNYNTILVGTDPVAVDRIGHDIVIAKRIEEGIQSEDKPAALKFMHLAEELKLGVANRNKIDLTEVNLA